MPNWCENDLYVYGPNRELVVAGTDLTTEFDFERIVPMPEVLENIESDRDVVLGLAYFGLEAKLGLGPLVQSYGLLTCDLRDQARQQLEKRNPSAIEAGRQALKALLETGHLSADSWAFQHWGTRRNASDVSLELQRTRLKYSFRTAWTPPIPVIRALSKNYRANTFSLRYYESGSATKGHYKVKAGKVLAQSQSVYRGARGG
jgi:hypothetical protein